MFNGRTATAESVRGYSELIIDPTFWQALIKGKKNNWLEPDGRLSKKKWMWAARKFYDLILTGGDTTKFWEELLKWIQLNGNIS